MPDTFSKPPWGGLPTAPQSLLEPEFEKPWRAYAANQTPQTADKLLGAAAPVIDEALKSYGGGEAQSPALRARAKVLTLEAARKFDPTRAKFRTHLLSHLRGLRRISGRMGTGVYLPEATRVHQFRVDAAHRDLSDELGREPADAEIAARVGLPLDQVRRARAAPAGVLAGSQWEGPLELSHPDEKAWQTWVDAVYHDVGPIDQVILDHSLGRHGRPVLSGEEIAHKVGLSPGAISQRKHRLQNMLDEFDTFLGRPNG